MSTFRFVVTVMHGTRTAVAECEIPGGGWVVVEGDGWDKGQAVEAALRKAADHVKAHDLEPF